MQVTNLLLGNSVSVSVCMLQRVLMKFYVGGYVYYAPGRRRDKIQEGNFRNIYLQLTYFAEESMFLLLLRVRLVCICYK